VSFLSPFTFYFLPFTFFLSPFTFHLSPFSFPFLFQLLNSARRTDLTTGQIELIQEEGAVYGATTGQFCRYLGVEMMETMLTTLGKQIANRVPVRQIFSISATCLACLTARYRPLCCPYVKSKV